MKKLIFILMISYLFASEIALPQFSIDDGKIYNIHSEQYISDYELIQILNEDSSFTNDKDFFKYKQSINRLKFRNSFYIYALPLLGIGNKYRMYLKHNNSEYEPPNINDLLFASLIYSSYYGYNHNKKKKSLSGIIHKYNRIYQHIVPTPSDEIYIKDLPPSLYLNRLIKEIEKYLSSNNIHNPNLWGGVGMVCLPFLILSMGAIQSGEMNMDEPLVSPYVSVLALGSILGIPNIGVSIQQNKIITRYYELINKTNKKDLEIKSYLFLDSLATESQFRLINKVFSFRPIEEKVLDAYENQIPIHYIFD